MHAPPKCASTSILTALVYLVNPEAEVTSSLTSENLSCLDIHPYVHYHYRPTHQCVINAFTDPEYCKILILRDPLSRFLSAISSKYLIEQGPYARELSLGSTNKHELKKNYSNVQNLKDDVHFVSKRLMTVHSLGKPLSHLRPFSDSFSIEDLHLFDHVLNVSDSAFVESFLSSVNLHLQQFGVSVDALPRFNESPLSIPADFLDSDVLDSILEVYRNDYLLLGKDCPKSSDIFNSDFDFSEYAQRNSDKLNSSVLFYDVSSKFYHKDLLNRELEKRKQHLKSENSDLLCKNNELTLEKENASSCAQKLKKDKDELILEKNKALDRLYQLETDISNKDDEIQQLRQSVEKISYIKEVCILQISQLQEDLENLLHKKNTEIGLLDSKIAKKLAKNTSLKSKNQELSKILNNQNLQIKSLLKLLLKDCH